mmetsp:Transcript_3417/g.10445  ORF Transcript_3417/g.10445 Transcript_3417/m.10445 type:complete len:225 (-) Transcript_3417:436-1110(-)
MPMRWPGSGSPSSSPRTSSSSSRRRRSSSRGRRSPRGRGCSRAFPRPVPSTRPRSPSAPTRTSTAFASTTMRRARTETSASSRSTPPKSPSRAFDRAPGAGIICIRSFVRSEVAVERIALRPFGCVPLYTGRNCLRSPLHFTCLFPFEPVPALALVREARNPLDHVGALAWRSRGSVLSRSDDAKFASLRPSVLPSFLLIAPPREIARLLETAIPVLGHHATSG